MCKIYVFRELEEKAIIAFEGNRASPNRVLVTLAVRRSAL